MIKVTLNCVSGFLSSLPLNGIKACYWDYKITTRKETDSWLTVDCSSASFNIKIADNATGDCSVSVSPTGILSLRELDKQLKPGTPIKMTIDEKTITEEIEHGVYTVSCKINRGRKHSVADNKNFCFEIMPDYLAKTLNSLSNLSENKKIYFTTHDNKASFSAAGKNMTLSYVFDCVVNNDNCLIITQDAVNVLKNMYIRKEMPIAVSLVGKTHIIFESNDMLTDITSSKDNLKTCPPIPVAETDTALFSVSTRTLKTITDKGTDYVVFLCENGINKISCHNYTWNAKDQIKYSTVTDDVISYKNCKQSLAKQTLKMFLRYTLNKRVCTVYRKDNTLIIGDNGNTTLSFHV